MNQFYRISTIFLALLALGISVPAQECNWRALPGVDGQPTILDLLTGGHPDSPEAAALPDNSRQLLEMMDQESPLNPDSAGMRKSLFRAGLASMQAARYSDAVRLFSSSGQGLDEDTDCGLRFFRLTARYLDSYGGQEPIFAHFNGGFYNYLKNSLFWGNADSAQYELALTAAVEMVQWTGANSPSYLELLGDLVTGHPDRFHANYFGWLAYMRAATLSEGGTHDAYERKAIFALEYPGTNEDRFNRYRYTQLGKALAADLEANSASAPLSAAPPLRFFPESSEKRLDAMLKKAQGEYIARSQRVLKYDQEVNRKEVKRDSRFNAYALFLIAVIIGAAIFFWVKLRQANKTR